MKPSVIKFLSIIFFILLTGFAPVSGQIIKTSVVVKLEKLPQEKRIELQGFYRNIKQYVESQRWTDGQIPFEIALNIEIVIDRVRPSFEDVYSAQMFIASQSTGYKKVDKEWNYAYQNNQALIFDPNIFNSFTSLFDYYVYIIIGELLDRYDLYGGEEYFMKSLEIARLGQADKYNRWWDRREEYVLNYLRESHKPFREMTFAYDAAMYWFADKNEEETKLAGGAAIELLEDVANKPDEKDFLKNFFSSEYANLAALFSADTSHYSILIKFDTDHTEFYKNFLLKK